MDRLRAAIVRDLDDALELQVGLRGRGATDVVCLICISRVDRIAVRVGIDGGGRDAELAARAHDPDGDLASVRDEDFLEELVVHPRHQPTARSAWLGVTTSPSLT